MVHHEPPLATAHLLDDITAAAADHMGAERCYEQLANRLDEIGDPEPEEWETLITRAVALRSADAAGRTADARASRLDDLLNHAIHTATGPRLPGDAATPHEALPAILDAYRCAATALAGLPQPHLGTATTLGERAKEWLHTRWRDHLRDLLSPQQAEGHRDAPHGPGRHPPMARGWLDETVTALIDRTVDARRQPADRRPPAVARSDTRFPSRETIVEVLETHRDAYRGSVEIKPERDCSFGPTHPGPTGVNAESGTPVPLMVSTVLGEAGLDLLARRLRTSPAHLVGQPGD